MAELYLVNLKLNIQLEILNPLRPPSPPAGLELGVDA